MQLFLSVDPLASDAPEWNPYRYAFNTPIRISDPTGMGEEDGDCGGDPKKT